MTRLRFQGFEDARDAGDLAGTPDLRVALAMSGFSFTENAVNLADGTLDRFDGANYQDYDAAGVAVAWASNQRVWTCDNGAGDEFGTSVAAGSEAPVWLVVYLYVDGTAANDIILAASDEGSFSDGNGSDMGLTLVDDILLFSQSAA